MRITQRAKGIAILVSSIVFIITIGLELVLDISGLKYYRLISESHIGDFVSLWAENRSLFPGVISMGMYLSIIMAVLSVIIFRSITEVGNKQHFLFLIGLLVGFGLVAFSYFITNSTLLEFLWMMDIVGDPSTVMMVYESVFRGIELSRLCFGWGTTISCLLGGSLLCIYMWEQDSLRAKWYFAVPMLILPLPFLAVSLAIWIHPYLVFDPPFQLEGMILAELAFVVLIVWFAIVGLRMMRETSSDS